MEAHEEGGGEKANKIITNNKEKFKYMGFTLH